MRFILDTEADYDRIAIDYSYQCEVETDIEIEGNAIASGDKETDRKEENRIKQALSDGNDWAWCTITVEATLNYYPDGPVGLSCMGACSFNSEQGFLDSGLYEEMKSEAKRALIQEIANTMKLSPIE